MDSFTGGLNPDSSVDFGVRVAERSSLMQRELPNIGKKNDG